MLTKRQNMLETIKGGSPDRFVNQYEAIEFIRATPYNRNGPGMLTPGSEIVNAWGVTIRYQENTPGPFPVHDEEHIVLKDVTKWKEIVKFPNLSFPQEEWDICKLEVDKIDRTEKFAASMIGPGVFDHLHYLMGMEECLLSFYTEPEALKDLIAAITDWELELARLYCENFMPDMIFHHDDWGSHRSTFLSPEMFDEFIFPSYRKIYGYYKSHGTQLVIHHSDSYAATLVPYMIDMGIDVFQGCVDTNDVPELIRNYGGKISFMGAINNGVVDVPGWTDRLIAEYVEKTCKECGKLYFIPCCTAGGPASSYPGAYDAVTREIDRMSGVMFL
ncbi:MAG: uroporphyrinogen decarboxylase [Oscillospiraceae bacterium]|jgi:uroporphyrinogen-III decarboxylase|nr:uroporphyrinogen decarboxylase [Oscillospiraceae bacterium]